MPSHSRKHCVETVQRSGSTWVRQRPSVCMCPGHRPTITHQTEESTVWRNYRGEARRGLGSTHLGASVQETGQPASRITQKKALRGGIAEVRLDMGQAAPICMHFSRTQANQHHALHRRRPCVEAVQGSGSTWVRQHPSVCICPGDRPTSITHHTEESTAWRN